MHPGSWILVPGSWIWLLVPSWFFGSWFLAPGLARKYAISQSHSLKLIDLYDNQQRGIDVG